MANGLLHETNHIRKISGILLSMEIHRPRRA
jgi:hypothetical protein